MSDTIQSLEVCNLDSQPDLEILIGNGDIVAWLSEPNRVLKRDPVFGGYWEHAHVLGFDFDDTVDLTEEIRCADLDGDGQADTVVVGNTGQRNYLYRRQ